MYLLEGRRITGGSVPGLEYSSRGHNGPETLVLASLWPRANLPPADNTAAGEECLGTSAPRNHSAPDDTAAAVLAWVAAAGAAARAAATMLGVVAVALLAAQ